MKRSKQVRLILLGGFSAGALAGCGQTGPPAVSVENVYTNNYYLPGAGYYHAPFNAWYQFPYDHFDSRTQRYYYGGQWGASPFESIINVSSPTAQAASQAEAVRTDIVRGGFGSTSGGHWIYS